MQTANESTRLITGRSVRVSVLGLELTCVVETEQCEERIGKNSHSAYGYVANVKGDDGEDFDCYLG